MDSKNEKLLKDLGYLNGRVGRWITNIGRGGDGNVSLHEFEENGLIRNVAVKRVTRKDPDWQK